MKIRLSWIGIVVVLFSVYLYDLTLSAPYVNKNLLVFAEYLSWMSQIIVAGLASVALHSYFYQKRKDKVDAVISFLKFTRERLVPSVEIIERGIYASHGSTTVFCEIEEFKLESFEKDHFQVAQAQTAFYFTNNQTYIGEVTSFVNLLEEFALSVLNQEVEEEKSMESIIPMFVVGVEKVVMYIFLIALMPGNGTFPGVKALYEKWKKHPCVQRGNSQQAHQNAIIKILPCTNPTTP